MRVSDDRAQLGLTPQLCAALRRVGVVSPTEIQTKAIPAVRASALICLLC
jgi:superfamily II DNA/RNA helicase